MTDTQDIKIILEEIKEIKKELEELKKMIKNHRHDGHGYVIG